ncbi:MAG TPA: HAMP domain-containing sensor histidine kinase [Defluviitoga sp.]|nr:HAMP domain-containing sensor histidine kinase [Defluviitoga sp.]HOP24688.1 HAMP domain-containing sensor histidine kinase [Defluviitoga sp.]HPZ29107.1 HAMP domain-containing sensor histidine kinase [Defluviitoga sp.]HQD63039.1 HAMP domain-containing sensor histidine kinase [Defluviitoga sp.]
MKRQVNYDFYIENLQEMAQLFQQINWDESEKDFLDKLLKIAIKIIPEAECGSIWLIKGALYKAIVGEGYNQELLSKMEVPVSDAFVSKYMNSDILEVKNIIDYNTPETDLYKISKMMHKKNNNMVTLIATLKNGDQVAGHIYIDSFHIESFDEGSKKILEMFSHLASTFLTLKFLRDAERESAELNANYLSFISHELRTPLTAIIGFAETILANKDMTKKEIINIVKKILLSAKHMNSLIEDISTFNKLNRETTLHLEKVNLKKLIYEVLSILEVSASPNVEIVFNYPTDIPTEIETDSTKLKQILMNIIENAIKYTNQGYVRIDVNYENNTKHFIITIQDTGPGIPEEELKDIFKPFLRLAKDKPGSGLGLAIVKKNIEILKGDIEVESKLSVGTTFKIRVPAFLSSLVN